MTLLPYSFKDILLSLAVLLVIYYGYIILRYYRKELNDFIKGKAPEQGADELENDVAVIDPFERYHEPVNLEPIADDNYLLAEELILRIKELISESRDRQLAEPEVMSSVRDLLVEYPTLKDEILRAGITELILSEMKIHGFISASRSEVDGLWKMALG
ncbi:hypothetical protein PV783_24920 [Chitinophaga sp. CC14]|uniref:hypothetical protein n=1 Tax=Chitinophaga sp. CC14 TaxID=3029199 RepID=UPI003B80423E